MKTIIEQYIHFAVDNWYQNNILMWIADEKDSENWKSYKMITNFTGEIMSQLFIEAIARWLWQRDLPNWIQINKPFSYYVDHITSKQAIAIRDNTLEKFIIDLWIC